MNRLFLFFWLAAGFSVLPAWGQVYRCVDANDHVTYTNIGADNKNCKRLQVETAPVTQSPAQMGGMRPGAAATPAGFPRVSADAQRARDANRRAILTQELANEEQGLENAKQALAEQEKLRFGNEQNYQKVLDRLQPYKDAVELHTRNIDTLNREISALR